jgi:Bacterial regulatory protein, Fis family
VTSKNRKLKPMQDQAASGVSLGSKRLSGKVCVITGTGGSMGRATALIFAREGALVVGCDTQTDTAQATVEAVRAVGGTMVSLQPCKLDEPADKPNCLTVENMQKLQQYNWPGNVRELQHLVERNVLLNNNEWMGQLVLPKPNPFEVNQNSSNMKTLEEVEREHILAVLNQCNFRITGSGGAAEILGIPATTLHSKIKKLGIRKSYG